MDIIPVETVLALINRKYESLRVDYKQTLDLSDSEGKQELVKDIAAQANTLFLDETLVKIGLSGATSRLSNVIH